MHIAVIGQGNVGRTIGTALAAAGHQVSYGSRIGGEGGRNNASSIGDAIAASDVVVLAIPAAGLDGLLAEHGGALNGRVVIDATNRMGAPVANAAAAIGAAAPSARYVRAFNTLGWENLADPLFEGEPADLFFSAPEADRGTVEQLIIGVGLRPAYLGEGKQDAVDHALPLWFALSQIRGNRRIAFRVVEK